MGKKWGKEAVRFVFIERIKREKGGLFLADKIKSCIVSANHLLFFYDTLVCKKLYERLLYYNVYNN